MVFIRDTSFCHENLFAELVSNPTMHDNIMGGTQTGFTEDYAQRLRAGCDLDL